MHIANQAQQFVAAHAGEVEVRNDDVEVLQSETMESTATVAHGGHPEPLLTETNFEQTALIRVVLDNEDVRVLRADLNHVGTEMGSLRGGLLVSAECPKMCHLPGIDSEILRYLACAHRIKP